MDPAGPSHTASHPASHSALYTALVAALSARTDQAVEEITALVADRVDRLAADPEAGRWIRTSARTNVELLLQVMAYPDDLDRVQPPLGGVALVRRVAQRDVPFYELVRGYQLAEWYWVRLCLRELAALTADTGELVEVAGAVSALVRTYIDRVCQGLSTEYEAERERWLRRSESARDAVIATLLAGGRADPVEAEAALGYRLRRRHRAAVVWSTGAADLTGRTDVTGRADPAGRADAADPGPAAADPSNLRHAVAELARRSGCPGRPLVVARDHSTLWVWLPLPDHAPDLDELPGHPGVRVALGEPAGGLTGFVATHRQAAAAHEVGLVAGPDAGAVFRYREVSSLTFLCADLPRARAWLAETLGGLAAPGARPAELRRTVRVYSAARCSATATARLLSCHKNTVQYRVRAAERLLGHPVEQGGPGLDLALLAHHWLGSTLTAEAPADPP